MIAIIAATEQGKATAQRVAAYCDARPELPNAKVMDGPIKEAFATAWQIADALVCFLAVGATVRLVAPLITDKRTDPPVICINEGNQWVVPVLGGHNHTGMGGANTLASAIADYLGSTAVITTASDSAGLHNFDHLVIDPAHDTRPNTMRRILDGEPLTAWVERPADQAILPHFPRMRFVNHPDELSSPAVMVTSRTDIPIPPGVLVIRPQHLVLGVGSSRNCPSAELAVLIDRVLADSHRHPKSVRAISTIDAKRNEQAILDLANAMEVPLVFHDAKSLAQVSVPNPSQHPQDAVGTPSVAEASALLTTKGELLVEKTTSTPQDPNQAAMATAAVASDPSTKRGHLLLLGMGPGDPELVPPKTRDALASAEIVIGFEQYIDRCRQWVSPNAEIREYKMGSEVQRAEDAVNTAREGKVVALISGGDIGTFAMASPALEALGDADDIDVTVLPGITSSLTASSILGAPLGHDHCNISLSDLMTPWPVIQGRVKAAAAGDFIICIYNPRSKGRDWQLDWVKETLLEHRPADTPVGIVVDASRPTQQVHRTTLGELDTSLVDMLTMVIFGSTETQWMGDRMVTPRGYTDKYGKFSTSPDA